MTDAGNILMRRLLGHDFPVSWQLIHEIMLNDDFQYTRYGFLSSNEHLDTLLDIGLRSIDLSQQRNLEAALQSGNLEDLEISIGHVKSTLLEITNTVEDDPVLDSKFISQMVKNKVYGPEQLQNLIEYVCDTASEYALSEIPKIQTWKVKAISEINSMTEFIPTAARLVHAMIRELIDLKTTNSNIKFIVTKPLIKNKGPDYERTEVMKALDSGALVLDKTHYWLSQAHSQLDTRQLSSFERMRTIHRKAMSCLLYTASMQNKMKLRPSGLPETLLLDCARINGIRLEIRTLAICLSLHKLAVTLISPVSLTAEESNSRLRKIICFTETVETFDNLFKHIIDIFEVNQSTIDVFYDSVKNQEGNLRSVFTKRIVQAVVNSDIHTSLAHIVDLVRPIEERTTRLCSYLEQVYAQLYIVILSEEEEEENKI